MALLGVLLATGAALTGAADGGWVDRFDTAVLDWFVAIRTPALTAVAEVFSALGDTPTIVAGALAVAALTAAGTRSARPTFLLVVVLAGELTLLLVTAAVIARPRPDVSHLGLLLPPTSSYPSGHVSAGVCLYGLVALLAVPRTPPHLRWVPPVLAVLAAACVALGRLYFGVHHPTDVVGSVLYAVPWLLACRYLLPAPASPVGTDPVRS